MTKEKTQEYGTVRQDTTLDVDPCRHGSLFQNRSILYFLKGAIAILKVQGGLGGRLVCGSGTLCFCLRGRA